MTWFKVDDQLAFHPKVMEAGNSAMGLWVRAGSWCGAHLTDGVIPKHMISSLGAQRRDAEKLVAAGLWEPVYDGISTQNAHETHTERTQNAHEPAIDKGVSKRGSRAKLVAYRFTNWGEYQPTKTQVEAEREAARERQRKHRSKKDNAVGHGVTDGVIDGVTNGAPTRPDPTKRKDMRIDNDARFEEWWSAYPRKKAKGQAEKAYRTALKHTDHDTLLAAVKAYAKSVTDTDPDYIAYGSTWLNGKRWLDDDIAPADPDSVTKWLRECWTNADTKSVEARSGLTFRTSESPGDDEDITAFNRRIRQQWIEHNHDDIIRRIMAREDNAA